MKKTIISVFLLLGSLCFSQSVTEKYNSIYKRYEYFNSKGDIIGYKSYNNLSQQWEYYDAQSATQGRQPIEYKDPVQLDISSLGNAATILQGRYDQNKEDFKNELRNIRSRVEALNISHDKKQRIIDDFNKTLDINSSMITSTLRSKNGATEMTDWAYGLLNYIIKDVTNQNSTNYPKSSIDNENPSTHTKQEIINPKEVTNDKYLGLFSNRILELDRKLREYDERYKDNISFNYYKKEYGISRDSFSKLAQNQDLNAKNCDEIYQKLQHTILQISYISIENSSVSINNDLAINRICYYNKDGHLISEHSPSSYIHINEKEIIFKNAEGKKMFRNLINKRYDNKNSGFEYSSNLGGIFIPDNKLFVKFFENNDFTGNYYIYYVQK